MAINYFDQLVQGFGGQENELDKAIAGLGIQAQTPVRDVRAERLAAQAPQVSQAGSIEALMANQQEIQRIQAERAAALADLSAVGARRPSKRFLREGQSFMEAFKNPSEAQREFFMKAGAELLSDNGTKSLSQRIGQALGSGAQGLQEVRQQDIASDVQAEKAKLAALQLEQEGAQQQMGFTKDIASMRAAAQETQTANERYAAGIRTAAEQTAYDRSRDIKADEIAKQQRIYDRGRDVREDRLRDEELQQSILEYNTSQDPTSFANLPDAGKLQVQISNLEAVGGDPSLVRVLQQDLANELSKSPDISDIEESRNRAKVLRSNAMNLADGPEKNELIQTAELLEAKANRLAYGSQGIQMSVDPNTGAVTTTIGGRGKDAGLVGKSDFYDSQNIAALTTTNARAAVAAIKDPSYGASSGRTAPIAEALPFFLSDAQMAAQTRAKKINEQLMLLMTPYLKPMSNVDLPAAREAMKIPNNLQPEYQMEWIINDFSKAAMNSLDLAAINTKDAPQRKMDFGTGMALSLIEPTYDYKEGKTKFMVMTPVPGQRGRTVKNSVQNVIQNFFPRKSEADTFKGQGYVYLKGYDRVIPASIKKQIVKNLMAQSQVETTYQKAEQVFNTIFQAEEFK
jgi:hypothetical protein